MTDILVGGDYFVGRGHDPAVDASVRELAARSRYSMLNLEGPATESPYRIGKSGPHHTQPPASLDRVAEIGFSIATLANNHILDAGLPGLRDTLLGCHNREIHTVGASAIPGEARCSARLRVPLNDGSLTILNYCEREWSVREDGSGASRWDVLDAHSDIQSARSQGDRTLVALHGGNEYFPLPRPQLRKQLRHLADNGADAIVMHHSHVPAAYEVWNGVPIFYGLGNLQFTLKRPSPYWYEGLLVALTFPPGERAQFDIIPTRQNSDFDLAMASPEQAAESQRQLEGYRIQVTSDAALEARWTEFARDVRGGLIRALAPTPANFPSVGRKALRVAFARALEGDVATQRTLLDILQCESLHEVLCTALRDNLPVE